MAAPRITEEWSFFQRGPGALSIPCLGLEGLGSPRLREMQEIDKSKYDVSACGYVPRYNKLFSIQSIQRGVKFTRSVGGLNQDHVIYVLEQANLPTDGSVAQLRKRLKINLGRCLRPFVGWWMFPRTDLDFVAEREYRYWQLEAEFRAKWERIDAAEELRKMREKVTRWQDEHLDRLWADLQAEDDEDN
jgi:hypothetical protein